MSLVGRIKMPFILQDEVLQDGASSSEWVNVGEFWGQLTAIKSSDKVTHNLMIRYKQSTPVKVGQRAVYDGKPYLICKVEDLSLDKRWLHIQVREEEYLN